MSVNIHLLLGESVVAWEEKAEATRPVDVSLGPSSCPLCRVFHDSFTGNDLPELSCSGCPVREYVGLAHCCGSPYTYVEDAFQQWLLDGGKPPAPEAWVKAVEAEIGFLKSLMDPGHVPDPKLQEINRLKAVLVACFSTGQVPSDLPADYSSNAHEFLGYYGLTVDHAADIVAGSLYL